MLTTQGPTFPQLAVDPGSPRFADNLYIVWAQRFDNRRTTEWILFSRSTDRGKTWTRIQGFNFKWGHRVIPDPRNPAMIYITTFGGSVWHGPADGDPRAVEDIVTRALGYGR